MFDSRSERQWKGAQCRCALCPERRRCLSCPVLPQLDDVIVFSQVPALGVCGGFSFFFPAAFGCGSFLKTLPERSASHIIPQCFSGRDVRCGGGGEEGGGVMRTSQEFPVKNETTSSGTDAALPLFLRNLCRSQGMSSLIVSICWKSVQVFFFFFC